MIDSGTFELLFLELLTVGLLDDNVDISTRIRENLIMMVHSNSLLSLLVAGILLIARVYGWQLAGSGGRGMRWRSK